MVKFIVLTFGFLGWAFYEMSGGADYRPPERKVVAEVTPVAPKTPVQRAQIARAERARAQIEKPVVIPTLVSVAAAHKPNAASTTPAVAVSAQRALKIAALANATNPATKPAAQGTTTPSVTAVRAPDPKADLRKVVASRVNLRTGPGTDHNILATLDRGQSVEVLESNDLGWLRLRTQPGDRVGWIAERLISPREDG